MTNTPPCITRHAVSSGQARIFVVAFLVDFTIRIFVNPRYAPSLILGQWAVRSQHPEWVGAPQKRFAWAIGFVLAATMLYLVVIQNVIGPVNVLVCAACLMLAADNYLERR